MVEPLPEQRQQIRNSELKTCILGWAASCSFILLTGVALAAALAYCGLHQAGLLCSAINYSKLDMAHRMGLWLTSAVLLAGVMLLCCALARILGRNVQHHTAAGHVAVALMRLIPRIFTASELALGADLSVFQVLGLFFNKTTKGWLVVVCSSILIPVPLSVHGYIAILEWLSVVAVAVANYTHTRRPAALLSPVAECALLGVILPLSLLILLDYLLHSASAAAQQLPPPQPHDNPKLLPSQCDTPPQQQAAPLPADSTPPFNSTALDATTAAPCSAQLGDAGELPLVHNVRVLPYTGDVGSAPSKPRKAGRSLYKCRLQVRVVSVKVHQHDAYQHREEIVPAVEACLASHFAKQHDPSCAPAAQLRVLDTTAIRGCLQLLVSVYEPLPAGAALGDAAGRLAAVRQCVLEALPQHFSSGPITVDKIRLPALSNPLTVKEDVGGGACAKGVPEGIVPEPACVVAGLAARQGLVVGAPGLSGMLAEVVVCCWSGGRQVVVRQHCSVEDEGLCRLQLPAHLDAAPLAVHLVATCPARQGILLSSTTSMALPAAAARELLPLSPPHASDPALAHSTCNLLSDLAAAWMLLHNPRPGPSPCPPKFATEMLQYLASASLPQCHRFLSKMLHATPPAPPTSSTVVRQQQATPQTPQAPPGATLYPLPPQTPQQSPTKCFPATIAHRSPYAPTARTPALLPFPSFCSEQPGSKGTITALTHVQHTQAWCKAAAHLVNRLHVLPMHCSWATV